MAALFFINTGITATEFAGIAAWAQIFHLSRYIIIPLATVVVFLLVLRLSNKIVERVFVIFSLIYLSYVVSGIQAKPDWGAVVHDTLVPTWSLEAGFLVTVVGLDRNDDLTLHAVLSAVRGRRQGLAGRATSSTYAPTSWSVRSSPSFWPVS